MKIFLNIRFYCRKFQSIQDDFFYYFLFLIDEIVDIMDTCKSLNISIGRVMKNPEILKLVSDQLKTKKSWKHAVKKLPFLLRYIPVRYKTQQLCEKAI